MKRGDIVIAVTPGDSGKPQPAAVVQSDIFNPTHASITLCPITSHLVDAPLFRLNLQPTAENGLGVSSQIMVDKITTVQKRKTQTNHRPPQFSRNRHPESRPVPLAGLEQVRGDSCLWPNSWTSRPS